MCQTHKKIWARIANSTVLIDTFVHSAHSSIHTGYTCGQIHPNTHVGAVPRNDLKVDGIHN